MILIDARHAVPGDKQTRFSKWKKEKGKTTEPSRIRIQTSSSQWLITIKPRNWPPGFSISPLTSPLTTKAQSLKFESKTLWSTARRPKSQEKLKMSSRRRKTAKANRRHKKRQNGKEELRKAQNSKKRSKPKQKLKINTPPEINSP
jgi:hypothetical protein